MEKLINVRLVGSSYRDGFKIPGWKELVTSSRIITRPEGGGFDQAIAEAKSLRIDTTEFESKLETWVQTGRFE